MNILWRTAAVFLAYCACVSGAVASSYTLEGRVSAFFAGGPVFTGEIPFGAAKVRAYNYVDEHNFITYSAVISYGIPGPLADAAVPTALAASVQGNASSMNGEVAFQRIERVGRDFRAVFVIRHSIQGVEATKYSVTIYHAGNFYSWSVAEFAGLSKLSGRQVFEAHVSSFQVL